MSRDIKQTYTGFQRYILAEFMSEDELKILDNMYTNAKIKRMVDASKTQLKPLGTIDIKTIASREQQ